MSDDKTTDDLGQVRFRFSRTMSLQNWRFVLLIAVLAMLPAVLMTGTLSRRLVVFLAIMAVPFLLTGGPWLLNRVGVLRRVEAIGDDGILVGVGFRAEVYPWRRLFVESYVEGTTRGITQRVLRLRGRAGGDTRETHFELQDGLHGRAPITFAVERLGDPPLKLL